MGSLTFGQCTSYRTFFEKYGILTTIENKNGKNIYIYMVWLFITHYLWGINITRGYCYFMKFELSKLKTLTCQMQWSHPT